MRYNLYTLYLKMYHNDGLVSSEINVIPLFWKKWFIQDSIKKENNRIKRSNYYQLFHNKLKYVVYSYYKLL